MIASDRASLIDRVRMLVHDDESDIWPAEQIVMDELSARILSWTRRDDSGHPIELSISALQVMETTDLASLAVLVLDLDEELTDQERQREHNLVEGVRLLLSNPHLADRDCGDCERHVYDERTGRRVLHANLPVVRPAGTAPPCRIPNVGCPKGSPEQPRSLNPINRQVYRHYHECQATGCFPDDPIVRRNASLIQAVELADFQQKLLRRANQSDSAMRR